MFCFLIDCVDDMLDRPCTCIIGASLSEPHTSELAGANSLYVYIYISLFISYVFRKLS